MLDTKETNIGLFWMQFKKINETNEINECLIIVKLYKCINICFFLLNSLSVCSEHHDGFTD